MRCFECDSEMKCLAEPYEYKESGLDHVFLQGVEIYRCECGEETVSIPAIPELHALLGEKIINKKTMLNGKEIRFLRKNMGLTAKKLSGLMKVGNEIISRWEHGNKRISEPNDRLLRLLYIAIKEIPHSEMKVQEQFPEITSAHTDSVRLNLSIAMWAKDSEACHHA